MGRVKEMHETARVGVADVQVPHKQADEQADVQILQLVYRLDTPAGADYGVCEGRLTCHTNPGGPSIGVAAPQEAAHHMFPRRAYSDHPQKSHTSAQMVDHRYPAEQQNDGFVHAESGYSTHANKRQQTVIVKVAVSPDQPKRTVF